MKTTLRIARIELNLLFYSPIAWFLLVVFLFQCGLEYTSSVESWAMYQDLGSPLVMLTERIFGSQGMFFSIMGKLYLYLPLLTMGLMSRETGSGTIRLLYSSPVRVTEIVGGKFLAMMAYCFLLILCLAIFAVTGIFNIQHAGTGQIFSGLLGLYLLLCAYSAIGLFMSCLTSYQVVAAISTLVLFAVLSYIGSVWQDIDFMRDLTYFLSISGRADHLLSGLISTKDVLYFLIIVFIFLGFSIVKLQSGMKFLPWYRRTGRYAAILLIGVMTGYIFSRPGWIGYYDATANKRNTLSPNVQKIVKEMDSPLVVTSYINLLENHFWLGNPAQRNADLGRWEPYLRFKPDIQFNYVYYYDTVDYGRPRGKGKQDDLKTQADRYVKSYRVDPKLFKTPEEIHRLIDLRPEDNKYVMQLKYRGKTTFLRLFDDPGIFPGETETAAGFKRLMVKLPRIVFLQGELERSTARIGDRDYKILTSQKTFRYALINQGFDVDTVNLEFGSIPADIAALVIADPRTALDTVVMAKLRDFIAGGGNLLIAGEPGKQELLNPLLQTLGLRLMDGTLVQKSREMSPDLLLAGLTPAAVNFSRSLARDYADSVRVSMPGAVGIDITGVARDTNIAGGAHFDIQPLLMTNERSNWNKKGPLVKDSAEIVYTPSEGDDKRPVPTAVRLIRKVNGKEQRILVLGDADLLSNAELGRHNVRTANFEFNTALFGWLCYNEFPVETTRPRPLDNHLNLTGASVKKLKIIFLGVLPGLLLLTGAFILIRRKRK